MAFDATAIRVAGQSRIYIAALNTAPPATLDAAPGAGWTDLGFVTEDGLSFSFSREVNEIFAMQAADPVRVIGTRMPKTLGMQLMQQGREQFLIAMGGGEFAETAEDSGIYVYTPPDVSETYERSILVDMVDGDHRYRWYYKRGQNREGVEFSYVREDAATYPVSFQILTPADNSAPFTLTTDDPAFAAAA